MNNISVYKHMEKYLCNGKENYVSFFRPLELKNAKTSDPLFPDSDIERPFHDNDGYYERAFVSKIAELLNEDSVFFDIGANYGFDTFVAARHCNSSNIHSFEGTTSICDILQRSNYHFASGKINIVNAFVHNKAESGFLIIDNYVRETNHVPTLIKTDIEGYEIYAIPGMEWVLDTYKPILLIEFHPRLLRERFMLDHTSIDKFYSFLLSKGYQLFFNGHHYHYRSHPLREPDLEWRVKAPNSINYAILAK